MTNMMLTFVSTVGSGPKSVALIPIVIFVVIALFILRRKNKERKTMKFGVEIECLIPTTPQDPNHLTTFKAGFVPAMQGKKVPVTRNEYARGNSAWQVRLDGSISPHSSDYAGIEIVSRILDASKPSHWKEIQHVCEYLQSVGAYANYSCGLHIHIGLGAKNLERKETLKLVQRLFLRYARAEKIFDAFVPENRRNNKLEYAHSCNNNKVLQMVLGEEKDALSLSYNIDSKYWKVNLNSIEKFGTVEFRHFAGTVDAATIQTWARFLLEFVEQTKKIVDLPDSVVAQEVGQNVAADYGMTKGMYNLWQYLCHAYEDAVKNRIGLPLQADKPVAMVAMSMLDYYGNKSNEVMVGIPVELIAQSTGLSVKYITGATLRRKFQNLCVGQDSIPQFEFERADSDTFHYSHGRHRPIPSILKETFASDTDMRLLKITSNPVEWFKPIIKLDSFRKYSLWDGISPNIKSKLLERASALNSGDAVLLSQVLSCTC